MWPAWPPRAWRVPGWQSARPRAAAEGCCGEHRLRVSRAPAWPPARPRAAAGCVVVVGLPTAHATDAVAEFVVAHPQGAMEECAASMNGYHNNGGAYTMLGVDAAHWLNNYTYDDMCGCPAPLRGRCAGRRWLLCAAREQPNPNTISRSGGEVVANLCPGILHCTMRQCQSGSPQRHDEVVRAAHRYPRLAQREPGPEGRVRAHKHDS